MIEDSSNISKVYFRNNYFFDHSEVGLPHYYKSLSKDLFMDIISNGETIKIIRRSDGGVDGFSNYGDFYHKIS